MSVRTYDAGLGQNMVLFIMMLFWALLILLAITQTNWLWMLPQSLAFFLSLAYCTHGFWDFIIGGEGLGLRLQYNMDPYIDVGLAELIFTSYLSPHSYIGSFGGRVKTPRIE